jgi:hypothetical protein
MHDIAKFIRTLDAVTLAKTLAMFAKTCPVAIWRAAMGEREAGAD